MATAFEIKGPIALYRKPYTTTSTVSYPIPTPTAVAGLIAAILGLPNGSGEKESAAADYWKAMPGTRIAIQRLNRTAWFSAAVNFWNTKDSQKSPHVQIKHQFVRDPHYRIFVSGGLSARLSEQLAAGVMHFTPNLGVAYALAEVSFLGDFEPLPPQERPIEVRSAVPFSPQMENRIDFLATQGLMKDTLPFRMDTARQVQETITLLYPATPGQGIVLTDWEGLSVFDYHGDTIVWLPAW